LKSRKDRLSLIVASARLVRTNWIDWSKPSVPTSSAPFFFRQLAEVAGQRLGRLLALQVGEGLDAVVVAADDQNGLGGDIGLGEIIFLLALFRDADLVDDRVIAVGIEAGDQPIPFAFQEFDFHTELGADRPCDLDIEADQIAGIIVVREGRIGAFGADLDGAGLLDLIEIGTGVAGGDSQNLQRSGNDERIEPFHFYVIPSLAGVRRL